MTEQMTCQEYRSHLDEWLDGMLSDDIAEAMRTHRDSCAACAEETRLAEEALQMIRDLGPEEPVPLNVQASWRNAVRAEAKQRRGRRFGAGMRAFTAAAASFIALAGCTAVFRSNGLLNPVASEAADADPVAANVLMSRMAIPEDAFGMAAAPSPEIRYTYIASDSAVASAKERPSDAVQASGAEESADLIAMDSADSGMDPQSEGVSESIEARSAVNSASPLLIRSVSRDIVTDSFDSDAQSIRDLTEQYGGYLSVDSVTTSSDGARYSDFTCQLPVLETDSFLQALSHVGCETYAAEYFTDITAEVQDMSLRLDAMHAEEDRLRELLADANAENIAALNDELQSVLTEIAELEAQGVRFNQQRSMVAVSVHLSEQVLQVTAAPTAVPTLTERMGNAFHTSAAELTSFVHDMLISLMVIAPFLLTAVGIGAVVALIAVLIRRLLKK